MRHGSRDALSELWSGLSKAWRKTSGVTAWTGDKGCVRKDGTLRPPRLGDAERFDIAGLCRSVEITHGGNGWHLHAHILVVTASGLGVGLQDNFEDVASAMLDVSGRSCDLRIDREWLGCNAFASLVWDRWARGLQKAGLDAPSSVCVDVRRIDDAGEEVVEPKPITFRDASGPGGGRRASLGASRRCSSRRRRGRCGRGAPGRPAHWRSVDRWPPGDWRLWAEYESASMGRAQLVWSRSRKDPTDWRGRLWNRRPLVSVRPSEVQAWAGDISRKQSAATARHSLGVLRRVFDHAVRDGAIHRNPAAGIRLPKVRGNDPRPLTHDELWKLADHLDERRDRLLVLVAGYCGCGGASWRLCDGLTSISAGELCGLRVRIQKKAGASVVAVARSARP